MPLIDPMKKLEEATTTLNEQVVKYRTSAFERFPLLFVMLSTFGLVATLYGFEKLIDGIPLFEERGELLLLIGIAILVFTGSLYKKLR